MRKRIEQALMAGFLISILIVTPVFASSLEDMQADKAQAESEAGSLQEQIKQTLDKIEALEKDLETKQSEIDQAGLDLEEAAAMQTDQYNAMKLRIRYMYEGGEANFLETLLTATSFSDFINKAEYVQEVQSYDRGKLNEYEEITKKVEELKKGLEEEYIQMEAMQSDLEEETASLNATLEEKQEEITQLDASIQAEIAARQEAERRAREEAERQAREEAERQARQEEERRQAQEAARNAAAQQASSVNNSDSGGDSSGESSSSSGGGAAYVPPQGSDGWAVVQYARQFIGCPYVYGGNSLTGGIDCSGFTQQIYAAFGVSLPRVDSAQATCGVEIPLSEAQAGDLLCYWGHVGIYNGTGGIVHASSPGIGITEFANCQYRTLRCVRRVL